MARLRISRAAKRDLLEIAAFTRERWGEAQCDRYLGSLDQAMRMLARTPGAGRTCDHLPL